jgi:signal transduction histidine kinase
MDSLNTITNQDKLAELQAIYGKERIENDLKEARNQNKLLEQQKELDEVNWRILFLLLAGVSVVIIGFSYIRYVNKLRKQQAYFSQGLINQVDEERSRISKDLHDDIGQLLSVVKSKVNMFQTGRLANLDGLENEIGEVINHTRSISHELHPSSLEKLGLKTSLNSLLEKTQAATDLVCSSEIDEDWKLFDSMEQTQLFRIFQECISNTIKYARAKSLKISIVRTDEGFLVEYRDNGIGFEQELMIKGLGWLTIRERVHQMGGKMELNSGKGKGVHLSIKIKKS